MSEAFSFELVSPEALVLGGEALEVVVPGSEGYFTVLANHSPFMTTVKPGIVDVKMVDGKAQRIFVRGGFADVSPAGFTLLAEQATMLDDVDLEAFDQEIQNARDAVSSSDGDKKVKAEAMLAQLEESKSLVEMAKH